MAASEPERRRAALHPPQPWLARHCRSGAGSVPAVAEPAKAAQGTAAELGVMGVNLKDSVKFNWGFQRALQGAGAPNQAGVGAFIPIHVGNNSVTYVDVLVNANFSDYNGLSGIGTTKVSGSTATARGCKGELRV